MINDKCLVSNYYTGYERNFRISKYFEKKASKKKIFRTKIVGYIM